MNNLYYIQQLNLEGFSIKGDKINFRCPVCGDSEKSSRKKRGWILGLNSDSPRFYCHNCSVKMSLWQFLKEVDYSVWKDYVEELNKNKLHRIYGESPKKEIVIDIKTKDSSVFSKYLKTINELDTDHLARNYLKKRRISERHWNDIYYISGNPYKLYNYIFDDNKYEEKANKNINHKGIVVPMINRDDKTIGFVVRFINPNNNFRFIILYANDNNSRFFFGENKCNINDKTYIVEGLVDKLSFERDEQVVSMISANPKLDYANELFGKDVTYIFDYEMANKEIMNRIKTVIKKGFKVFLWNSKIVGCKDINDLICKYKISDKQLFDFIDKNTYIGLEAELILNQRINELNERRMW